MKLSINILSWNCLEILKDSLPDIMEEIKGLDAECIIIDNGSDDGTKEFVESSMLIYRNLVSVRNKKNLGISKGKNKGIKVSKGEYILMLDADIIPVKNSIKMLVAYLDDNQECDALGFRPNKWSNQRNNKFGQIHHEDELHTLYGVEPIGVCCIFYGIFRRKLFIDGLMMCEEGQFGQPGYGWEDHDFYERMKHMGVIQYVADVNRKGGKYYHAINSSIRVMGHEKYIETSKARNEEFKRIWNE